MADLVVPHTIRGDEANAQVLADIDDNFRSIFRKVLELSGGPTGGLTPGVYGSATLIPIITVNADGVISSITVVVGAGGGGGTDDAFVMAMSGI